jgi:hypothetical protein
LKAAAIVVLGALLFASHANASGTRVGLVVTSQASSSCIDARRLASAVDDMLERDAVDLDVGHDQPTIHATLEPTVLGSWRAALTLETGGKVVGTREVIRAGASCSVLDGPLAVVTALLVDVAKQSIRVVVPPPPPPEPPPPPVQTDRRPAVARVSLEVAATVLAGLLPGAVPGVRVEASVTPPRFAALVARMDTWPYSTTGGAGPHGDFHTITAGLGICPDLFRSRGVRVGGCVAGMVGLVRGAGEGITVSREATAPLVLVSFELGVAVRLVHPLWLHASAGLLTGQRPSDWHFDRPGGQTAIVFQPAPVAFLGSVGLSFDLMRSEKQPALGHP